MSPEKPLEKVNFQIGYLPQPLSLCSRAHKPQLLNPCATTTEAHAPRARALQQEKPPQ